MIRVWEMVICTNKIVFYNIGFDKEVVTGDL